MSNVLAFPSKKKEREEEKQMYTIKLEQLIVLLMLKLHTEHDLKTAMTCFGFLIQAGYKDLPVQVSEKIHDQLDGVDPNILVRDTLNS
jgi:hypothetical protein